MNPEKLLTHASFVQSLARSLVMDDHLAADVTQETWLAALKHPPQKEKSVQSWLYRVVKNFTVSFHRESSRRKTRELTTPDPEAVPTPEKIVEKMEIRRRLTSIVLKLNEPYRTAIVLHYYEGMKSKEIAKLFNIPDATVRTRISRGLEFLRQHLDTQYGGDRNQWRLALAPLACVRAASSFGLIKALVLLVCVIGISIPVWRLTLNQPEEVLSPKQSMTESAPDRRTPPAHAKKTAILPSTGGVTVFGSIRSWTRDQEIPGAKVRITPLPFTQETFETASDENGAFKITIPIKAMEAFLIKVSAHGYRSMETRMDHLEYGDLYLEKNHAYAIRVEDNKGLPIVNARAQLRTLKLNGAHKTVGLTTDTDGRLIITSENLCYFGVPVNAMLCVKAQGKAPCYTQPFNEKNIPEKIVLKPIKKESFQTIDRDTHRPVGGVTYRITRTPLAWYFPEHFKEQTSNENGFGVLNATTYSGNNGVCVIHASAEGYVDACVQTDQSLEKIFLNPITGATPIQVKDKASGLPLEGVRMEMTPVNHGNKILTNKSGIFYCPLARDLEIPIKLTYPGYKDLVTLISPSSPKKCLHMEALDGLGLIVRVNDEVGDPVVMALVKTANLVGYTDEEGFVKFNHGVNEGELTITRNGFIGETIPFPKNRKVLVTLKRGQLFQGIKAPLGVEEVEAVLTLMNGNEYCTKGRVNPDGLCQMAFPPFVEGRLYAIADQNKRMETATWFTPNDRWVHVKAPDPITQEHLIRGVVLDEAGNPLYDVEVGDLIHNPHPELKLTRTDADGAFYFLAWERNLVHNLAFSPFILNNRIFIKLDTEKVKAGSAIQTRIPSYNYVLVDFSAENITEILTFMGASYWLEDENGCRVNTVWSYRLPGAGMMMDIQEPHKVCFVGVPAGTMRAALQTKDKKRFYSHFFYVEPDKSIESAVRIEF